MLLTHSLISPVYPNTFPFLPSWCISVPFCIWAGISSALITRVLGSSHISGPVIFVWAPSYRVLGQCGRHITGQAPCWICERQRCLTHAQFISKHLVVRAMVCGAVGVARSSSWLYFEKSEKALPGGNVALVVKNPPADAGDVRDTGSIPGLGRSPGEGNGNPLQYSCLGNPVDKGAWQTTVHGVEKSWTQLSIQTQCKLS